MSLVCRSSSEVKRSLVSFAVVIMSLVLVKSSFGFVMRPIIRVRQAPVGACNIIEKRYTQQWKKTSTRTLVPRFNSNVSGDTEGETSKNELDDFLSQDVEKLLSELSSSSTATVTSNTPSSSEENEWVTIDWDQIASEQNDVSLEDYNFRVCRTEDILGRLDADEPSPVEGVLVRNRVVYLKRDDLLRLKGSGVSGNKARKMYALNQIPAKEFPDVVVSYGGPQSNAMVALAAVVLSKNLQLQSGQEVDDPVLDDTDVDKDMLENEPASRAKRFVYYTKKLPRFLRNQPSGNLFRAKSLGVEIVELTNEEYQDLFGTESGGRQEPPPGLPPPGPMSLWIPQGGACGVAVPGTRRLANEIISFWKKLGRGRPLSVCLPGGTCGTAVLLHREIRRLLEQSSSPLDIRVVVVPCIGDDAYARRQMMSLNLGTGGGGSESDIPAVLTPDNNIQKRYFRFGEPKKVILETFREMREENGVNVDLLYGAPTWTLLLQHWREQPSRDELQFDERHPLAGREVMYVHTGGLEGIASQMLRYKHKGLVASNEIQLPGRNRKSNTKGVSDHKKS